MSRFTKEQSNITECHELLWSTTPGISMVAKENDTSYHAQPEECYTNGALPTRDVSHTYSFPYAGLAQKPGIISAPLGKPTAKKRLLISDILTAGLSVVCAVVALFCVADDSISWYLSPNNRQLAVLGLLLSIMNLCLGSIYPRLFLLLEARFGKSALQNYDGIVRNAPLFDGRLDMIWRFALGLMLAFPLGLSVAYKQFNGGVGTRPVAAREYVGNSSYYGMFAPPGLTGLGYQTGLTVFSNATIPFQVATSATNGTEPALPSLPQPYGFNVLLLSKTSSAILDIPQSSYINAVQRQLAAGESWTVTANVLGTVATLNESRMEEDQRANSSYFLDFCAGARASSGAYAHMSMIEGWCIVLVNRAQPGNASEQYVALAPDPGLDIEPSCAMVADYARPLYVTRQSCSGTWVIDQSSITLLDGHCDPDILPPEQQLVITRVRFWLPISYMSSLVEILGPFAFGRNNSAWTTPYMATATAAMIWSKVAAASNITGSGILLDWGGITHEQARLFYTTDDRVVYNRPVLRNTASLYAVIVAQPFLLIVMLGALVLLHTTPIDKGFGLTSILGGIDSKSLGPLTGSALSGELTKSVKLIIEPSSKGDEGTIQYRIASMAEPSDRGNRLKPGMIYS